MVAIAADQQNPGGFDLTYLQRSCGGAAGAFEDWVNFRQVYDRQQIYLFSTKIVPYAAYLLSENQINSDVIFEQTSCPFISKKST